MRKHERTDEEAALAERRDLLAEEILAAWLSTERGADLMACCVAKGADEIAKYVYDLADAMIVEGEKR